MWSVVSNCFSCLPYVCTVKHPSFKHQFFSTFLWISKGWMKKKEINKNFSFCMNPPIGLKLSKGYCSWWSSIWQKETDQTEWTYFFSAKCRPNIIVSFKNVGTYFVTDLPFNISMIKSHKVILFMILSWFQGQFDKKKHAKEIELQFLVLFFCKMSAKYHCLSLAM